MKYDLETGDFVFPEYTGMSVKIRFPDEYSGGCYVDKVMCSDFKGAYTFPLSKHLLHEIFYFARVERNHKTGVFIRREEKLFDGTKTLLVRSRCEVDPLTKKIVKCHYSQISDLQFGCGYDGIVFLVESFFNPTPNDTNLEPK